MKTLVIIQIISAILLSVSILLQQKGTALSATFGGDGGFKPTKRGAEKVLYNATIVFAIVFVANSVAFFFI